MDDNEYAAESDRRPHLSLERHLTVGPHVYHLTAAGTGDDRIGLSLVGWNTGGEVVSEISGGIPPTDLAPVAEALTSTLAGLAALRGRSLTTPVAALASTLTAGSASSLTVGPAPAAGSALISTAVPAPAAAPPLAAPAAPPLAAPVAPPLAAPVAPPLAAPVERPKRYPNQGVRWSAEDDARLTTRHEEGASIRDLMAEFGRSRPGIAARLEHLGLIAPGAAGSSTRFATRATPAAASDTAAGAVPSTAPVPAGSAVPSTAAVPAAPAVSAASPVSLTSVVPVASAVPAASGHAQDQVRGPAPDGGAELPEPAVPPVSAIPAVPSALPSDAASPSEAALPSDAALPLASEGSSAAVSSTAADLPSPGDGWSPESAAGTEAD